MLKFCDFCNTKYEFDTHLKWMNHRTGCKYNPNRNEKYRKISNSLIQKRDVYIFNCKKCNKKYKLILTENVVKKGKYKKFCSRSCANSRILTDKIKIKISEGIKNSKKYKLSIPTSKKIKMVCFKCKKEFLRYPCQINRKYCSRKCLDKDSENRDDWKNKISNTRKKLFKENKLKVTGGNTKWYTVETSNGKIRVQGTYEVKTCKILDSWKINRKIKNWEYTNDRIEYIGTDEKTHLYLLDFKILKNDNSFYYLETKGYKRENDELKWKAVKYLGYELKIWYDRDIKKYYGEIAQQVERCPEEAGVGSSILSLTA